MAIDSNYYWQEQAHRAPCNCEGCSECTNPINFDGILRLVEGDNDKCYSSAGAENGETYVYLPAAATLQGNWCVRIQTTNWTIAVVPPGLGEHIYVDGVAYDGVYVSGAGGCFCYNGRTWTATGDVMGYNGG